MTSRYLQTVQQVVLWRLCIGCGACVSVCENNAISLRDFPDRGIRPLVDSSKCEKCGECVKVCPGIGVEHQICDKKTLPELVESWGPVLEVHVGNATDSEIRYKGSSGGIVSALALFALERQQVSKILQIGPEPEYPLQNRTVFSKNRKDILACTGSRYSPASPCEKFNWIRKAKDKCVFIGKPCDVAALRKAQNLDLSLDKNIVVAISIFCAGTPTTNGTNKLLDLLGIEISQVEAIRYRGNGWPGMFTVCKKDDNESQFQLTYKQSWDDVLSKHRQLRCHLCPDSTGELADIACGDPWYRKGDVSEAGTSLVLVRTEKGRKFIQEAVRNGYIKLQQAESDILSLSQQSVLKRRQNLFGRLLVMRALWIPTPKFVGFCLFRNWWNLKSIEKLKSILGTFKRALIRKWLFPKKLNL